MLQRIRDDKRLLPTAYCLLPTAYCLLPTAYCYCLLPTAVFLQCVNRIAVNSWPILLKAEFMSEIVKALK